MADEADSKAIADASAGKVPDLVEVRMLVPRASLVQAAPAPELVSQESSLELFGLPPRRFLEIVRSPRFPGKVLRVGRLRLVRRTDLLDHLEVLDEDAAHESPDASEEPAPAPAPSLADRLGLVESKGARQRRAG